jgi:hypothetical protein
MTFVARASRSPLARTQWSKSPQATSGSGRRGLLPPRTQLAGFPAARSRRSFVRRFQTLCRRHVHHAPIDALSPRSAVQEAPSRYCRRTYALESLSLVISIFSPFHGGSRNGNRVARFAMRTAGSGASGVGLGSNLTAPADSLNGDSSRDRARGAPSAGPNGRTARTNRTRSRGSRASDRGRTIGTARAAAARHRMHSPGSRSHPLC